MFKSFELALFGCCSHPVIGIDFATPSTKTENFSLWVCVSHGCLKIAKISSAAKQDCFTRFEENGTVGKGDIKNNIFLAQTSKSDLFAIATGAARVDQLFLRAQPDEWYEILPEFSSRLPEGRKKLIAELSYL